jgi:CHAT domain-containing protein
VALLHAQRTFQPIRRSAAGALLVTMDHSFQGNDLPMIADEATIIENYLSPSSTVATVATCHDDIQNIKTLPILHLACHGTQSLSDAI